MVVVVRRYYLCLGTHCNCAFDPPPADLNNDLHGGIGAAVDNLRNITNQPPGPPVPGEGTKPHLVFAMIDDWGWYDNGFHGNSVIKTPFLDAMVRNDALLLERHYVFKYCSPTRRSFLSGRVPPHSGQANGADVTVDTRMHTIAAKLKQAGYRTGMSGKWHAGHMLVKQQPHGVGFDTSLGYMNGACDHYTQIDGEDGCAKQGGGPTTDIWNTDRPGVGLNGTYGDLMYVGRAVETIMQHDVGEKAHPLFYYLAMQCAHDPMEAPQRFLDIYAKDDFCGNGGKSKSKCINLSIHMISWQFIDKN